MDKLTRLEDYRAKTLGKITELRKRIMLLDVDIAYLRQKDELLQRSDAEFLGEYPEGETGIRPDPTKPVQSEPWISSLPDPPPQAPKAKGPVCNSCGSEGSLYATTRSMSSGKMVQLVICDECKTEQIR